MKMLEEILSLQSYASQDWEVRNFIFNHLARYGLNWEEDKFGNIFVEKGKPPYPTFCAHLDTVHPLTSGFKVKKKKKKGDTIFWSPTGIGGDDKCGIWGCLRLLEKIPNIKVVFFVEEEMGQVGSSLVSLKRFKNSSFLCELDRRGDSDIISSYFFEPTISWEFELELEELSEDWIQTEGSITDVMVLFERGLALSAINISSGYWNPHTKAEFVTWKGVCKMLDLAKRLALLEGTFPLEEPIGNGFTNCEFETSLWPMKDLIEEEV